MSFSSPSRPELQPDDSYHTNKILCCVKSLVLTVAGKALTAEKYTEVLEQHIYVNMNLRAFVSRMKVFPVLFLLFWMCAVYIVGIHLFIGGFLLVRLEVNRTSSCTDTLYPGQEPERDFCSGRPRFRRAVLLIVDALKIDFARFDPNNTAPRPYENKLPVLEETVTAKPSQSRLYPFRADPPTTTMQRIKGFTTGSLPTFVDVGNNFASSAILEDNLIHQLGQVGE